MNSIKGEEFVVTLPISVKSMWRSNFGIVMENDISSQDSFPEDISSPTPKLLALHHPLDDFTRIVAKQSRKRSSSSHVFTNPESTNFFHDFFFLQGIRFLTNADIIV